MMSGWTNIKYEVNPVRKGRALTPSLNNELMLSISTIRSINAGAF
jgi:hypothetical protein